MFANLITLAVAVLVGGPKADIGQAVGRAVEAAARNPDTALQHRDVQQVTEAIVRSLPPPAAAEAFWPQAVRYAISWYGVQMAARGYGDANDWDMVAGAVITVGPFLYRCAAVRFARWRAARGAG